MQSGLKKITQLFYVLRLLIIIEMNECNDVYSCLIDASKAFDMVHWGKLFLH